MWKRMTRPMALAAVLAAGPALLVCTTNAVAQTNASKTTKMNAHPEKQPKQAVVPQVTKPMPAPKKDAKASSGVTNWVPGDYYWNGDDWVWAEGYSLDRPWADAIWISGHWTQRWWGWTWVPGYWF